MKDSRQLTDEVWELIDGRVESVHQVVKATLEVLNEWGYLVMVELEPSE